MEKLEFVGKKQKRGRVLPKNKAYFVHVMSRIVDRRHILGHAEKEQLREIVISQAEFSGIEIVTYALMDNHFHLLLHVPEASVITDKELLRRVEVAQGKMAAGDLRQFLERMTERGFPELADQRRQEVLARMFNLSAYMQQVKRLFTRWYNRVNERKGTLWEARYKSVVVEGAGHPLLTMAAYIDLNAVRAGIVEDPKDYRWCGYGEAVAGSKRARAGLKLVSKVMGRSTDWRMVARTYRKWVYAAGEQEGCAESGTPLKKGIKREDVKRVWEEDGDLKPQELIHCRIRYFNDGVVLGTKAYVDELFEDFRDHFSKNREQGAKKLCSKAMEGLFSLRDLKVDVIS